MASGGEQGAWARLERSEIAFEEFCSDFEAECAAAGGQVSAAEVLGRLGKGEVRPEMIEALRRIKAAGLKTAAITNNWVTEETSSDDAGRFASFRDQLFDAVVESAKVGMRKPDPRIYELACDELGVEPAEAVFLDDLGVNLKPARAMGMATIKVVDPDDALAELEETLGFPVRSEQT